MTLEEYRKQIKESLNPTIEADVGVSNKGFDVQKEQTQQYYDGQMKDTKDEYRDLYRKNETQKYLDSRFIERRAAEMGSTDSGLNRSQQTAVALSHANQQGKLQRQEQKAIDTLAAAMTAKLTEIDTNKAAAEQSIRSGYEKVINDNAVDMFEAEQKKIADIETARIKAENERLEKESYIISSKGAKLSRNFAGSLIGNGVEVEYNRKKGTTTYKDTRSGFSSTFPSTVNPYTGNNNATESSLTASSGRAYGYYDNGYQPRGIVGYGEFTRTEGTASIYGRDQNVFVTDENNGIHYWLWDGAANKYIELFINKNGEWEEKVK